ncbi:MAG: ABC transporter substrate-binding protein [Micromonosporaceae bacterium]
MLGRTLAAAMLLTLVACGSPTASSGKGGADGLKSSFGPVFKKVEGMEGQARRDELIKLAKKEGDVKWYTSHNADIARAIIKAYQEETGLKVSLYRAGSETVRNRALEEAAAGRQGGDVVETNGPELTALADEGVFEDLESPVQDALTKGSVRDGWTASRFNIFTIAWNTKRVPGSERPTSYADLADPAWDGKMALEIEDFDWYWALRNHLLDDEGMSEQEVDAYFQDVADGATFASGHSTMRQQLIAGEFALLTSDYSYGIADAKADGAPVDWQPSVEPLFARPNGVGLVRNAANPAAALAFTEWMLSDGQDVLAENNIDPTRDDLLDTGDAEVKVIDVAKYLSEEKQAQQQYEKLIRLGEQK